MTAKIILTVGLCGVWLYAWTQASVSRIIKLILYTFIVGGNYFVWFPDQTTVLANALGIGRGADLILYTWIVLSFGVILNVHLKLRQNLNLVTELARHIAIAQPNSIPINVSTDVPTNDEVRTADTTARI